MKTRCLGSGNVVLRSPEGHYLAGGPTEWEFSDDLTKAAVFNYPAEEMETHLKAIRASQGLVLQAVHVAATELCETCDRCKENVLPTIAFFDGKQFLCPDCSVEHPEHTESKRFDSLPSALGIAGLVPL